MNNNPADTIKPLKNLVKPTDEYKGWCPNRNRVFYKKYLNEINQALQSLITAGRLKRMELMSINNRALFNKGKIQRCQWSTKKHVNLNETFLPDVKNLYLNNRTPKNQTQVQSHRKRYITQAKDTGNNKQKYLDQLIQQQILRIKQQKLLEAGQSQRQIVKEACKAIQQKLMLSSRHKRTSEPINLINLKSSRSKFMDMRRDHRRTVTESIFSHQIEQIQKKNMAIKKQRQEGKKYFLRKIQKVNLKGR